MRSTQPLAGKCSHLSKLTACLPLRPPHLPTSRIHRFGGESFFPSLSVFRTLLGKEGFYCDSLLSLSSFLSFTHGQAIRFVGLERFITPRRSEGRKRPRLGEERRRATKKGLSKKGDRSSGEKEEIDEKLRVVCLEQYREEDQNKLLHHRRTDVGRQLGWVQRSTVIVTSVWTVSALRFCPKQKTPPRSQQVVRSSRGEKVLGSPLTAVYL